MQGCFTIFFVLIQINRTMKKYTINIIVAVMALVSCKSMSPVSNSNSDSVLMTIDCRNESDLKQIIVMRLRGTKARNLQITPEGAFLKIRAVFLKREVSPIKLYTLSNDIKNMGGVLQTLIEENRGIVVQTIDRSPVN
jgi:hypothetical protein